MSKSKVSEILSKDASIEEMGYLLKSFVVHIKINRGKLILFPLMMGVLGLLFGYAVYQNKKKAEYIIAAEEENAAGWEGLLAQFGLDVGGSNPGGVFMGESLVHLFQTRSMIERALLKPMPYKGDTVICADLFFRQTAHARKKVFDDLQFARSRDLQNAVADSALYLTYKYVRKKVLEVSKPDKKMGFIYVKCIHPDAHLAAGFSEVLIATVTDFYIESLTFKARKNLNVLQNEADSVQAILDENLYLSAFESDLNVNPTKQSLKISQNRAMIDLQISIALFGELTKNLKLAEIGLRKQTPLIQIIQKPNFPLEPVGFKPWQMGLFAMILALMAGFYFSRKQQRRSEENDV